jgi:hypothetical protein
MRLLALHASALSDAENDFYTASLYDITAYNSSSNDRDAVHDTVHFEPMSVGIREAERKILLAYPGSHH